jgi:class 3 adenylate cyclase
VEHSELSALIRLLTDLTHKVARGDYRHVDELFELTKPEKYPPTIYELAESFGMMLVQVEAREFRLEQMIDELAAKNKELEATLQRVRLLENIKDQLCKFVPCSVKDQIESNPENPDLEKRDEDVTVLFLDVAGYTRLSERVEQEKVNYLLQTYFSSFLDVILQNQGDINETAGDGLMIIFRDEDAQLHAANAVRAAMGIRNKTDLINEAHQGLYDPVTVNMGINSGLASVGSTRFEGIAGTRWTYTASGPVTNIAARISALASEGAILAGPETYKRVRHAFRLDPTGRQQLKNIRKPVRVYRVV